MAVGNNYIYSIIMPKNTKLQKAFTLVELSISIVIIGTILAAIFLATDLIKVSELKVIIAKQKDLQGAVTQFRTIYGGLPGDISNAQALFGSGLTRDGNNDGIIASERSASFSEETFEAVNQLALSGVIEGKYTGLFNSQFSIVTGGNVINLDLDRAGGMYIKCCSNNPIHRDYDRGVDGLDIKNHIMVFMPAGGARDGLVTPIEALSIDKKTDDGNPDAGFVGAEGGWKGGSYDAVGCYTGSAAAATYDKDDVNKGCQMMFGYDWE